MILAKFIPKFLTVEKEQLHFDIAENVLGTVNSDLNFLSAAEHGKRICEKGPKPRFGAL